MVCVDPPPTAIVFTLFSFTLLPAVSPAALKNTLMFPPGMQPHGGGSSATLHENELAFASWHDPTLELSTLEILNAGPAAKATDMITSPPVFSTLSR